MRVDKKLVYVQVVFGLRMHSYSTFQNFIKVDILGRQACFMLVHAALSVSVYACVSLEKGYSEYPHVC